MFRVHVLRRALWFMCACAILLAPREASAGQPLAADFDGDGTHDLVAIDQQEPSVLRVWLSRTGTTHLIRNPRPVLQVIASDLDGDHRPELIARDTSASGLLIWKKDTRRGFRVYHPRRSLPRAIPRSGGKSVDNDPADGAAVLPGSAHLHDLPGGRFSCHDASTDVLIPVVRPVRALARDSSSDPAVPRPPPTAVG